VLAEVGRGCQREGAAAAERAGCWQLCQLVCGLAFLVEEPFVRAVRVTPKPVACADVEYRVNTETKAMRATYSRLSSGEWGIRVHGSAQPGQQIVVTALSGESHLEKVDTIVWQRGGLSVCTIDRSQSISRHIGPRHHPGQQMLDL